MRKTLQKNQKGFTRIELILTISGLVVLSGLLIFAVVDTRRRSRDAQRVSTLRQVQFDLLLFRNRTSTYPDSFETLYGTGVPGYAYAALPAGCQVDTETLCTSYQIDFNLEGVVGVLPGGSCQALPDGITCAP